MKKKMMNEEFFLKKKSNWAVFSLLFRNPPIRGSALTNLVWKEKDEKNIDQDERNYLIWNSKSDSSMYLKLFKFKNYS